MFYLSSNTRKTDDVSSETRVFEEINKIMKSYQRFVTIYRLLRFAYPKSKFQHVQIIDTNIEQYLRALWCQLLKL